MKVSRNKLVFVLAVVFLILLPLLITIVANALILTSARPYIKAFADLPHAQAAIVLGAGVRPDGSPSAMLEDRLTTGVALYKAGIVKKLILSGDHGRITYDEANAMRRFALGAGLPREDVFLDHAGFSTYETMYRAREVFRVTDAIVVTQRFHLARAVYTARTLGINAWGCEADKRPYQGLAFHTAREWLARVKAVLQLHVTRPLPRYLGPPYPITGDGRTTWDGED